MNNKKTAKAITKRLAQQKRQQINKIITNWKETKMSENKIESLDDLLNSREYQDYRFGASSDDWLQDPERMERIEESAKHGCDGSTHGERIGDWRECLANSFDGELTEQTRAAIEKQIDECEQWHIENGSIDQQLS